MKNRESPDFKSLEVGISGEVDRLMNPHYGGLVLKLIVNHDVYNSSQFSENKASNTGIYVNKVSKIMGSRSRSSLRFAQPTFNNVPSHLHGGESRRESGR